MNNKEHVCVPNTFEEFTMRYVKAFLVIVVSTALLVGIYSNLTINAANLQYNMLKSDRSFAHKCFHPLTSDHEYAMDRLNQITRGK